MFQKIVVLIVFLPSFINCKTHFIGLFWNVSVEKYTSIVQCTKLV